MHNTAMAIEELKPGTIVNYRYTIKKIIGHGGFGRTYLVSDQHKFKENYVLKEFCPSGSNQYVVKKAWELFQREAEILHNLDHPQIPKFHGAFRELDRFFIVQDYVDGQTFAYLLKSRKDRGQTFNENEVQQWLISLLPVLEHIHGRKFLHRDISPNNILHPNDNSSPVLIDFGVGKQLIAELNNQGETGSFLSRSVVYKPGYSPNEQLRGAECTPSSDLYSLAATAVELLTGENPNALFDHSKANWKWRAHAEVSDAFATVLDKMLAQTPQDRYQSAVEVLSVLKSQSFDNSSLPEKHSQTHTASKSLNKEWQGEETILSYHPNQIQGENCRLTSSSLSKFPKHFMLLLISGLLVFLIGSFGIVTQSAKIPGVCRTLDNCLSDEEFDEDYHQSISDATVVQQKIDTANEIEDLQTAQSQLQEIIFKLDSIPESARIYSQAQLSLQEYQQIEANLKTRLDQEQEAITILEKAKLMASDSQAATELAVTVSEYEDAKSNWSEALITLNSIPENSFVREESDSLKNTYQAKIDNINQKIVSLKNPPPSPKTHPTQTPTVLSPSAPSSPSRPRSQPAQQPSSSPQPAQQPSSSPQPTQPQPALWPNGSDPLW